MLNPDIASYIESIKQLAPAIQSVWLFGSRANSAWRHESDWDLFVMGSIETYRAIADLKELHRPDVDLLVVVESGEFQSAFGDIEKSGSLNDWEWNQLSEFEASYTANHCLDFDPEGDGFAGGTSAFQSIRLKAYRVG